VIGGRDDSRLRPANRTIKVPKARSIFSKLFGRFRLSDPCRCEITS